MNTKTDFLNRWNFIENVLKLVKQLSEIKKGCCFSIEGSWGIGKTFVLEKIRRKLQEEEKERYFVFHYNCWQYDYYEEPSVAIISAMMASIKEDAAVISGEFDNTVKAGYQIVMKKLKEIVGTYIENQIGINVISVVDTLGEIKDADNAQKREFDEMFKFTQAIEETRKKLLEIAQERTIILIVDELDRCIPQYAIKVLERLHHIFYGLENVVVIMAVDREQLEYSIEEMFGMKKEKNSMSVERYLKKFMDFSMKLDKGEMVTSFNEKYCFYFEQFWRSDIGETNEILWHCFKGIDIRTQEKLMEKINVVHSIVCNQKLDLSLLVFEVIYSILELFGVKEMESVIWINERVSTDFEKIGSKRLELLKELELKAWNGTEQDREIGGKLIHNGLCGKLMWYFANLFNKNEIPYLTTNFDSVVCKAELETAKKYCEYCEIIK